MNIDKTTDIDFVPTTIRYEWAWESVKLMRPLIMGTLFLEEALMQAEKQHDGKITDLAASRYFKKLLPNASGRYYDQLSALNYLVLSKDPYAPAHYAVNVVEHVNTFISCAEGMLRHDKAYDEASVILRLSEEGISNSELMPACNAYADEQYGLVSEATYNKLWKDASELLNSKLR